MQVNEALKRVDTVIEKFINGLKDRDIYDCVNFIIVSDHGELYGIMCLYIYVFAYVHCMYILGMGDYENMSQRLLFLQVSRLLRLLATLHMYVDFIQLSN